MKQSGWERWFLERQNHPSQRLHHLVRLAPLEMVGELASFAGEVGHPTSSQAGFPFQLAIWEHFAELAAARRSPFASRVFADSYVAATAAFAVAAERSWWLRSGSWDREEHPLAFLRV